MSDVINIEVSFALAHLQKTISLQVAQGTTALAAVKLSGITNDFPQIELDNLKLGVFGKLCPNEAVLNVGDRVEIYRPLIADPKEVRRKRAASGKVMRKGHGE